MNSLITLLARRLSSTLLIILALMSGAVMIVNWLYGMGISGAVAFYFVIWWVMLFISLPFGVKSQAESGQITPGTDPGAPSFPNLREKAIWTSIVASIMLCASGAPIRWFFAE
jgi:predicted secreted protein